MHNTNLKHGSRNYAKKLVSLLTFITLLFFSACGEYSSKKRTVTAVDGYVKNATVTDAKGQTATNSAKNGEYTFKKPPTYPIKLTGGVLEDTNQAFDIDMVAHSGLIISPITTFIDGDDEIRQKLSDQGFSHVTSIDDFAVNYIGVNDANLSKLAQLLYIMLRDKKVANAFKEDLKNSEGTDDIDDLFIIANKVVDNSSNANNVKKSK